MKEDNLKDNKGTKESKKRREFLVRGPIRGMFNESTLVANFETDYDTSGGSDISNSRFDNFFHPSYSPDLFSLPYTLADERDLFLWFYERDPYVGHAVDLLTELPISKVHHTLPLTEDSDKAYEILKYTKLLSDKVDLFQLMMEITHEYWLYGNAFIYVEKNSAKDSIERVLVLDPNIIRTEKSYFSSENLVFLVPDEELRHMIKSSFIDNDTRKLLQTIPDEIQKAIYDNKMIELNTDPYEGTFVHHLARRKSQYHTLGTPILRRCLNDLMYRERLRQAQVSIAMRNLSPKHLITTEAPLDPSEADNLRDQIDASMETPDYTIVTTFNVNWQQIGADTRILQLTSEWEEVNTRIAAGLGLRREMIFGDGVFGDTKLQLDIMDKRFSFLRDRLQDFVESKLWAPICYQKGWVEGDDNSKVILTPGLSFRRLGLRDNETAFQNLFQLYNKGSLSVRTILDLFNIDPDQEVEYLQNDLFTLNDSRFNDLLNSMYTEVGNRLGQDPRFHKILVERGMGIKEYQQLPMDTMAKKIASDYSKDLINDIVANPKDTSHNPEAIGTKKVAEGTYSLGKEDQLELSDIKSIMVEGMRKKVRDKYLRERAVITKK
jgi:hypothetical protein